MNMLTKITTFVNEIGIPCKEGVVREDSFLPGVDIVQGVIIYDSEKLLSPGDILHEAGHMAVLKPEDRQCISSPEVNGDMQAGGAEMAAIAWSWAALCHLQIPPEIVFHEKGYKDDSTTLINNFSIGEYLGVPLLQWFGMTVEYKRGMTEVSSHFPAMKHWLRQN